MMNTKAASFTHEDVSNLVGIEKDMKSINERIGTFARQTTHFKATSKLSVAHDRMNAAIDRLGEAIDALADDLPGGRNAG